MCVACRMRPFYIHYLEWATSCQPEKVGGTHHEVKNPTKSTITQMDGSVSVTACIKASNGGRECVVVLYVRNGVERYCADGIAVTTSGALSRPWVMDSSHCVGRTREGSKESKETMRRQEVRREQPQWASRSAARD